MMQYDPIKARTQFPADAWEKSFASGDGNGGNCLYVNMGAADQGVVGLMHDKLGEHGPVIVLDRGEWNALVDGFQTGQFKKI